jgi:hypothetical protein
VVVPEEALADHVRVDPLLQVEAGEVLGEDVLDVRVRVRKDGRVGRTFDDVQPRIHLGVAVAGNVLSRPSLAAVGIWVLWNWLTEPKAS